MTRVVNARGAMHEYDKSSKWLIQHHGDSILRLGGVRGIVSWRALQAELVQPRRLPDGLIEATLQENLLAVTQILAGMRYNNLALLQILGGREAMIESPVLQEFLTERQRKSIILVLVERFGPAANSVVSELDSISDDEKLDELTRLAAKCLDIKTFKQEISTLE
jgi:hypothetical protein